MGWRVGGGGFWGGLALGGIGRRCIEGLGSCGVSGKGGDPAWVYQ
jgi:hypothetical protein